MTNILISLGGNCSTNHDLNDKDFTEIIGVDKGTIHLFNRLITCLLYTSPSPRDE